MFVGAVLNVPTIYLQVCQGKSTRSGEEKQWHYYDLSSFFETHTGLFIYCEQQIGKLDNVVFFPSLHDYSNDKPF